MSAPVANCPSGKPVWCTPTAKPRCSFGHHSLTSATFTGSEPPRLIPIGIRRSRKARKLPANPKVSAPPRMPSSMAMFHVHVRRYPVPIRSEIQPKKMAPKTSAPKKTELIAPAWVALRSNSSMIAGSTAGRIPPSMAVIRMAPVVISRVHPDIACPRGNQDPAPGFVGASVAVTVSLSVVVGVVSSAPGSLPVVGMPAPGLVTWRCTTHRSATTPEGTAVGHGRLDCEPQMLGQGGATPGRFPFPRAGDLLAADVAGPGKQREPRVWRSAPSTRNTPPDRVCTHH